MVVPTSSESSCITVIGAQWGNEGKGKITDVLCKNADVCARFNGGSNNIHTISINQDGKPFVGRSLASENAPKSTITLGLFPLGVANKNCQVLFGNGMVLHLPSLLRELDEIKASLDPEILARTFISTRAHIVFDFHRVVDTLFDGLRENRLGTTQMGVGPAYSTKTIRNGLRMGDLFSDRSVVREKIQELVTYFAKYSEFDATRVDVDKIVDDHLKYLELLRPCIVDTVALMATHLADKHTIVCEGANSVMSDLDFGTYPYVTSSNTTPGSASIGLGIPPTKISKIIGVCKAYTTRSQHWFPSRLDMATEGATIAHIVAAGNEHNTRRPSQSAAPVPSRHVGWLDLAQVKYATGVCGFDCIALTKLDVLTGLPRIGLVTSYSNWDVESRGYPATDEEFHRLQPCVEYLPGWTESLSGIKSFAELPEAAKVFVARIQEVLATPVEYIQIGAPETVLSDRDVLHIK